MSLHSAQQVSDGIHTPISFEYANAAARTGASLLPSDIGKFSRQLDDNSIWMLTSDGPTTWLRIDGTGGITSHAVTHQNGGSDEVNVAGLSGLLADAQNPLAHASMHLGNGTDAISIATPDPSGINGLMSGADKQKTDLIDTGLCRIIYPLDAGVRSSSSQVAASTNNNMPALKFIQSQTGQERWTVRPPQNYVSGDLTFRLYASIISSGTQNTEWEFGFNFISVGNDLGSYTIKTLLKDMTGELVDKVFILDFTILSSEFNSAADIVFFRIARNGAGANDTFLADVYIHCCELRYTGWRLAGMPLGS